MTKRIYYGLYISPALAEKLDGFVANGVPGDRHYFANRAEFLRAAISRMEAELSAPAPAIRRREKVQPVATPGAAA